MEPDPCAPATPRDRLLRAFWSAIGGAPNDLESLHFDGEADWPGAYELGAFAAAAVGCSALALASLCRAQRGGAALPPLRVDQRLAALWFGMSLRPQGLEAAAALGCAGRRLPLRRRLDPPAHQCRTA